ncbi:YciI family protein [Kibdelosporangium lantanae]
MLLIYGCHREELPDGYDQVNAYVKDLMARGVFRGADALYLPDTATTVQVRSEETLITDGPYAETHEALGGYFMVDCANLDEAMELAALCPLARLGSVEIRPVLETTFG